MKKNLRKPIPWIYTETAWLKVWLWKTPHFEVRIFAEGQEGRKYSWKITDTTNGRDKPFDSEMTISFQEAEKSILKVIGKSYNPRLGYQEYAGCLATTFSLRDGNEYDFGPLAGQKIILTYLAQDLSEQTCSGLIQVNHYKIEIRNGNKIMALPSTRIIDLKLETSGNVLFNTRKAKTV